LLIKKIHGQCKMASNVWLNMTSRITGLRKNPVFMAPVGHGAPSKRIQPPSQSPENEIPCSRNSIEIAV
jgi:hypothetical protein